MSIATIIWDAVVVLRSRRKRVYRMELRKLLTLPVNKPPASDENVVVPRPYFLYSPLIRES